MDECKGRRKLEEAHPRQENRHQQRHKLGKSKQPEQKRLYLALLLNVATTYSFLLTISMPHKVDPIKPTIINSSLKQMACFFNQSY